MCVRHWIGNNPTVCICVLCGLSVIHVLQILCSLELSAERMLFAFRVLLQLGVQAAILEESLVSGLQLSLPKQIICSEYLLMLIYWCDHIGVYVRVYKWTDSHLIQVQVPSLVDGIRNVELLVGVHGATSEKLVQGNSNVTYDGDYSLADASILDGVISFVDYSRREVA
jgi:hypothetical protein